MWLTGPIELLASKAAEKDHRPLVDDEHPAMLLEHQLATREPLVLALDSLVIDVFVSDDDAAAELIVAVARDWGHTGVGRDPARGTSTTLSDRQHQYRRRVSDPLCPERDHGR